MSANWDFLAPDDRSYEDEIQEKIKTSGTSLTLEDRMKRQERLLALFMEKKRLYDSSEPMFRIKGKNTEKSSLDEIKNLYIPTKKEGVSLDSLGKFEKTYFINRHIFYNEDITSFSQKNNE